MCNRSNCDCLGDIENLKTSTSRRTISNGFTTSNRDRKARSSNASSVDTKVGNYAGILSRLSQLEEVQASIFLLAK